jgi:hypothetical protein
VREGERERSERSERGREVRGVRGVREGYLGAVYGCVQPN